MASVQKNSQPEEIIAFCNAAPPSDYIAKPLGGSQVVRLCHNAVAKFGVGVSIVEAQNQQIARSIVNETIIRIPKVHQFFSDMMGRGYLVMEYIPGQQLPLEDDEERVKKVASILSHFAEIRAGYVGPLGGGVSRGVLFSERFDFASNNLQSLEDWCNNRLLPRNNERLNFANHQPILCHLDLAPRNLIWQDDGSVALIDWASAGFFPRLFEMSSQSILGFKAPAFSDVLLSLLHPLSEDEERQVQLLGRVYRNTVIYSGAFLDALPGEELLNLL